MADFDARVLTAAREESWEWRLLDLDNRMVGVLDGVVVAQLSFSVQARIKSGGRLEYRGQPVDWLRHRIQPVYTARTAFGEMSWPLGVFIPSTPGVEYSDGEHTEQVELYDLLQVLDQDVPAETVAAVGDPIVAAAQLIELAGGEVDADEHGEMLAAPRVFDPELTRLQIVNELAEYAGFFSVAMSPDGRFQLHRYTAPGSRGVVWDFRDDALGVYLPELSRSQDLFNVPNRVKVVSAPTEADAVFVGVAQNDDPGDPASVPSRGRVVTQVDAGVEATSQRVVDEIAARRLVELASPAASVEITHALLPLALNSAVTFRFERGGIDVLGTVQRMDIDTSTGALCRTVLREIV